LLVAAENSIQRVTQNKSGYAMEKRTGFLMTIKMIGNIFMPPKGPLMKP